MQFSSYALDLLATDLSKFTNPSIPELELKDDKTLQNNMLEAVLGVFGGEKNARARHLVTNFVRRSYASVEMYKLGRQHALAYVSGGRRALVTPYFLALTFFESCLAYAWQVADLSRRLSGIPVFQAGDRSAWERLHGIYTVGTKHSSKLANQIGEVDRPTTIWLTNDGVSCATGLQISYEEIRQIIIANDEIFYEIRSRVRAKQLGCN